MADNEVPDLYRLAFMPGVFRCKQCDFQLSKQTMSVSSGTVGVSQEDHETEECPNDGSMMVPVTYREQLAAYETRLFQELDASDALKKEIASLQSALEEAQEEHRSDAIRINRIAGAYREEIATLKATLDEMRKRYAIPENQALCIGYDGGCDGDLEGTEHEEKCHARVKDVELRPHLYAAQAKQKEPA